jgi:2-keto-4-pentenoate hydratase/2-oxohepta-3-ene-1,7-dioic acid hydratase in catechol pathway
MRFELPVLGDPTRPLRPGKALAAGKNYRAHSEAMADGQAPEKPLLFMKPASALVAPGGHGWYPPGCESLHPEAELVVVVGRRAAGIRVEGAMDHVLGFAAGLDMTDRGWQARAKAAGYPWEYAKAYDGSALLGPVVPRERVPDWRRLRVRVLAGDGELLQEADPAAMTLGVPELLAHASERFTLEEGDLLFTGAPAGTRPVEPGGELVLELVGFSRTCFQVLRERPGAP